jgi:phosphoglycerol transferase MdoB-like AlkP superfamily enzyme
MRDDFVTLASPMHSPNPETVEPIASATLPAPGPASATFAWPRHLAALGALFALLSSAAILNGYPFLFSDSGSYVASGFERWPPLDGTIAYGLWIRATASAGTLWIPALLQTLLLASLIWRVARRLAPQLAWKPLVAVGAVLALSTTAPLLAPLVLPDVFLPIGLLALGLVVTSERPRRELAWQVPIILFSGTTTLSTLATLSVAAGVVCLARRQLGLSFRRAVLVAGLVFVCWPLTVGLNLASHSPAALALGWRGSALSTLAESGELGRYLERNCPDRKLALCTGEIPEDPTAFLWSPRSAFTRAGGWGAHSAQDEALQGFFSQPANWPGWAFHALARVGLRLVSAGRDSSLYAPLYRTSAIFTQLRSHYPADVERASSASQQHNSPSWFGSGVLQFLLVLTSAVALGLRWRKLSSDARALTLIVSAGILAAVAITAILGMPRGPRSGARVVFLLPLFAMTAVADPLTVARRLQRWARAQRAHLVFHNPRWVRGLVRAADAFRALGPFPWVVALLEAKLLLAHVGMRRGYVLPSPLSWLGHGLWRLITVGDPSAIYGSLYLVTLGSVLLLTSWTLLLPQRAGRVALWSLAGLVSLLALSDSVYCRYFHDLLSIPVLGQAGQVGELGDCIRPLLKRSDLLFGADFLLLGWLAWRRRGQRRDLPRRNFRVRLATFVVATGFGVFASSVPAHWALRSDPGLLINPWSRQGLYTKVGLLGLHAIEAKRFIAERWFAPPPSPEELRHLEQWVSSRGKARLAATPLTGTARGKNVIVVQLESFQNFVIGRKVDGVEITPHINALMPQMLYVPNYYHQSAEGRTSDAEFISNCSLLPLEVGSAYLRYPDDKYVCLPQVLRDAGYETAAFHGNEGAFYNRYYIYPRIGFDHFYDLNDFKFERTVGWALGDRTFFRQSVERMQQMKRPFYAFLITLSSHYPYHLPDELKTLPQGPLQPGILSDYLEAVHFLDEAIGILVDELKKAGLWDESILIMYGDHDDGIPDDDPNYARLLGEPGTLDRLNLAYRVGMMVHVPGEKVAGRHELPAGQYDLAPTVLDALGMDSSHLPWLGQKLLAPDPAPLALRYASFVSPDLVWDVGDSCVHRADGTPGDPGQCNALKHQVTGWLNDSQEIISHDLQHSILSGSPD